MQPMCFHITSIIQQVVMSSIFAGEVHQPPGLECILHAHHVVYLCKSPIQPVHLLQSIVMCIAVKCHMQMPIG